MKNFFLKTIQTGAFAMVMLAGNLHAQYPGGYRGDSGRYQEARNGYREARVAPWEDRLAQRRHFMREREREIERELSSGWVRGFRRVELMREKHRIHEELEHMPGGYRY